MTVGEVEAVTHFAVRTFCQSCTSSDAYFVELDDEETYKRVLAEKFGIKPGNPRYQKAMAIWAEIRRART